jgi:hypothetical protein
MFTYFVSVAIFHSRDCYHTSARVKCLLPPKNGFAFARRGSISFCTAETHSLLFASFSSSDAARNMENMNELIFVFQVSTKKLMRARSRAEVAELLEAGRSVDGLMSAMNCATIADSVMISSLRVSSEYLRAGTSPRWVRMLASVCWFGIRV